MMLRFLQKMLVYFSRGNTADGRYFFVRTWRIVRGGVSCKRASRARLKHVLRHIRETVLQCARIMIQNCLYGVPLTFDGSAPVLSTDVWNYSSSTCITEISTSSPNLGFNPTSTISTSTDVAIYGYFSAGEVLICFLLFCIILIELCKSIAQGLSRIKTKKTNLGYSGGDVEIREDM